MKDPVCGMEVKEGQGPKSQYQGQAVQFCSDSCKAKFDKAPQQYMSKARG